MFTNKKWFILGNIGAPIAIIGIALMAMIPFMMSQFWSLLEIRVNALTYYFYEMVGLQWQIFFIHDYYSVQNTIHKMMLGFFYFGLITCIIGTLIGSVGFGRYLQLERRLKHDAKKNQTHEVDHAEKKTDEDVGKHRHFTSNFWFILTIIGLNLMLTAATQFMLLGVAFLNYKTSLIDGFDLVLYNSMRSLGVSDELIYLEVMVKYLASTYYFKILLGQRIYSWVTLAASGSLCLVGLSHYRRG